MLQKLITVLFYFPEYAIHMSAFPGPPIKHTVNYDNAKIGRGGGQVKLCVCHISAEKEEKLLFACLEKILHTNNQYTKIQ